MSLQLQLGDWQTLSALALPIRLTVFVEEQGVPLEMEQDEWDAVSQHVVVFRCEHGERQDVIGTGRLLPDGHIGRMAVLKEWRGHGVGRSILKCLLEQARQQGHAQAALYAQTHALPFYALEGFAPQGPVFMEAGIPHQMMVKPLSQAAT